MRKIILYIASSLDGKIADAKGSVDWLHEIPNPDNSDYGYTDFLKSIDTTLMGNKTYQKVLGFDVEFPYKGLKNYVITRDTTLRKDENVEFISDNIPEFIKKLKNQSGKNIWCIGGGQLNTLVLEKGLLDEIQMFTMPVILGKGIPLIDQTSKPMKMERIRTIKYKSGVIEIVYKVLYE